MQLNLSVISSTIGKRAIGAMKLHQHFEFVPASQDPFSFCQIQLALDTVYMYVWIGKPAVTLTSWAKTTIPSVPQRKQVIEVA